MSIEVQHQWEEKQWDWPLQHDDGIVKVLNDNDKFEVALDAQYFTPKEIQVKVVGNILDIHFEHAARKDDYGDVTRSVTRSYKLPEDIDPSSIKSELSARGTLVINAAKKH